MGNLNKRAKIKAESKERMARLTFGGPVTNICAGEKNPMRLCLFVRYKARQHVAECTDGKGRFADFDADVIVAGHLPAWEAKELYRPVWEANFSD